jgi:hypothetical protein
VAFFQVLAVFQETGFMDFRASLNMASSRIVFGFLSAIEPKAIADWKALAGIDWQPDFNRLSSETQRSATQ